MVRKVIRGMEANGRRSDSEFRSCFLKEKKSRGKETYEKKTIIIAEKRRSAAVFSVTYIVTYKILTDPGKIKDLFS